ncbi:MAG: hypothetical protein IT177_05015 [Acidobacteria bacterium]|nr:hypothetical protein [Acidobacteriota bacterium]
MSTRIRGTTPLAALLLVTATGLPLAVSPGCSRSAGTDTPPHVEHMVLPPHKVWRVISVQPYEGLEEVELVKVDWPTQDNPRLAFALTREDLKAGDPICLDHILEIDTLWAHPVPQGGCEARPIRSSAGQ